MDLPYTSNFKDFDSEALLQQAQTYCYKHLGHIVTYAWGLFVTDVRVKRLKRANGARPGLGCAGAAGRGAFFAVFCFSMDLFRAFLVRLG